MTEATHRPTPLLPSTLGIVRCSLPTPSTRSDESTAAWSAKKQQFCGKTLQQSQWPQTTSQREGPLHWKRTVVSTSQERKIAPAPYRPRYIRRPSMEPPPIQRLETGRHKN